MKVTKVTHVVMIDSMSLQFFIGLVADLHLYDDQVVFRGNKEECEKYIKDNEEKY